MTFETLLQEYQDHLNGWEPPRRVRFHCCRCWEEHDGILAVRYGQQHYYREYEDGSVQEVDYGPTGLLLCRRISEALETNDAGSNSGKMGL